MVANGTSASVGVFAATVQAHLSDGWHLACRHAGGTVRVLLRAALVFSPEHEGTLTRHVVWWSKPTIDQFTFDLCWSPCVVCCSIALISVRALSFASFTLQTKCICSFKTRYWCYLLALFTLWCVCGNEFLLFLSNRPDGDEFSFVYLLLQPNYVFYFNTSLLRINTTATEGAEDWKYSNSWSSNGCARHQWAVLTEHLWSKHLRWWNAIVCKLLEFVPPC